MSVVNPYIDYEEDDEAQKRVDDLMEKYFDKHFNSFEEFKEDLIKHIEAAQKDIEEGRYFTMEEVIEEFKEQYGIQI